MIILIPILIFILILVGLIILTSKVSHKLSYKKIGYGITAIILIAFLYIPFSFTFDGFFFSKSDAQKVLKENKIELFDDFEFERKSISGIMDYVLEFKILITEADKEQILETVKSSEYRVENGDYQMSELYSKIPDTLKNNTILYATYETQNFWNIERIVVLRNRYIRTNDIVQISKQENSINMIRNE